MLSHSATRNGASLLLLRLLQWLRAHSDLDITILCCSGGPLLEDYRLVAPTQLLRGHSTLQRWLPGLRLAGWKERLRDASLRITLGSARFDLVYANTAATWPQLLALQGRGVPALWHIHELPYALRLLLPSSSEFALGERANRFVAVSTAVAQALFNEYGVDSTRIDLVPGFVQDPGNNDAQRQIMRSEVVGAFGWPADAFVVGGCGGLGWRKGSDLFVQIASACRASSGDRVRFLWVGGHPTGTEALQFAHDLRQLGLDGLCQHIPSTTDVTPYYAAMDVFALTSREDPYPLVMLEAGAHGVPPVCFAGAGGGPEFVRQDAGLVVPYLDVPAFAGALGTLLRDPGRRRALGDAARVKVIQDHSVEHQGPRILTSIERCLQRS